MVDVRSPCCPWGRTIIAMRESWMSANVVPTFLQTNVASATFVQTNVVSATFVQTKVVSATFVQKTAVSATFVQTNVLHAPGGAR